MMFIGMNDPGLIVCRRTGSSAGCRRMTSAELIEKLGAHFTTRIAGEGTDLAPTIWDEIEADGEQGTLGLFTPSRRALGARPAHRRGPPTDGRCRRRA